VVFLPDNQKLVLDGKNVNTLTNNNFNFALKSAEASTNTNEGLQIIPILSSIGGFILSFGGVYVYLAQN
jgi:hypothetical protein